MTYKLYRPRAGRTSRLAANLTTVVASAAVLGGALALPQSSVAGTIAVAQCGDVYDHWGQGFFYGYLPYTDGPYGYQAGGNAGVGARLTACDGQNWAMDAALTGTYSQAAGAVARWRWVAPPDTLIKSLNFRYRFETADFDGPSGSSGAVGAHTSKQTDPAYVMRYNRPGPQGPGVLSDYQTAGTMVDDASWVDFWAGCDAVSLGRTCPTRSSYTSRLLVYGATFGLADDYAPTASAVGGSVVDSRYWRGVEGLTVTAADRGLGVYKAIVQQRSGDGTWTDKFSQTLDAAGGKCAPVEAGNRGGLVAFAYARPCPNNTTGDIDVDTRTVPEGEGQWRVQVSDATDNRTTVSAPQIRVIDRTKPTVSFADTADSCTAGTRTLVQGTADDGLSGIQSVTTLVVNAAGSRLPVAADGTIECPAVGQGPLAITTTATDKAGNTESVTRSKTVAVNAAATPTPDRDPFGNGTQKPTDPIKPTDPTPAPQVAQPTIPAPTQGPDKTIAARLLFACSVNKDIVLTEASPSGRKDIVRGFAAPQYAGQTVSIAYGPKRQVVAKLPVGVDGTFQAVVKAPRGKAARSNAARYTATVGKAKSAALKRVRRMYSTLPPYLTKTGNAIYVTGRLTKPFPTRATVTVRLTGKDCATVKAVKKLKVDSRGYYGDSIAVDTRQGAYIVRATAKVKVSAKSRRTFGTATQPVPVQMQQ